MSTINDLAQSNNSALSPTHRDYLLSRGLTEDTIRRYLLGTADIHGDSRITIPVFGANKEVLFFKCRRSPELDHSDKPKYVYYSPNSEEEMTAVIYGAELLADSSIEYLIITEGELDALVLRQKGFLAISSTGGCGTFPDHWADKIKKFNNVYIAYDNDEPGVRESVKVARKLKNQQVFIVDIPREEDLKDVSEYFIKYPDGDFSNLLASARKYDPDSLEFADFEIIEGRREFIPSQYFTRDCAYLTLKLHTKEKDEYYSGIYVVTSDRKIVELEAFAKANNYYIARKHDMESRWSRESITNYLNGFKESTYFYDVFIKTTDLLKYYLDIESEQLYKVIALWLIGTYFYRQFKAYPYFNVNGLMNSGKSKMLELCALIAFNGELLMGSTPAYIIRSINDNCATICLDEAEKLKDTTNPDSQTLIYMLNSGYKMGPKIGKMSASDKGKGWNQVKFDPYSPKMIAGINNISDTLLSRSVNLTLIASDKPEIKNREINTDSSIFKEIRDGMYVAVMNHFKLVKEAYTEVSDDSITGRNWEVWKPILTIACVLDELRGDNEPLLYQEIVDYARSKIKVTAQISEESQSALQLLLALKQMMESDNKEEAFYPTENIKTYLIQFHSDEFGWLKDSSGGKYLGPTLRKTGVIEGGSHVKWFDTRAVRGYDLNLQVICHRLRALGVEI